MAWSVTIDALQLQSDDAYSRSSRPKSMTRKQSTDLNGHRIVSRAGGIAGGKEKVWDGDAGMRLVIQLHYRNLKAVIGDAPVLVHHPVLAQHGLHRPSCCLQAHEFK